MHWNFSKMIDIFSNESDGQLLLNGKWGLEEEALRVTPDGALALTPHPSAFGDKIVNPYVTTDFSESQMELITPAFDTIEGMYSFLGSLKDDVNNALRGEMLWPQSMPGPLPADDLIPIARYGNTDDGKLKEIYRSGLALRYGKKVQMVSGIHYNFSFQDAFWKKLMNDLAITSEKQRFINDAYVGLVRNILRYRWLLIYLFGASPLTDDTYHTDATEKPGIHNCYKGSVSAFGNCTRHATSLRMSRFGYENGFQGKLSVSYNSLDEYIRDIRNILLTKNESYSKLGLFRDGRQIQLNDHLLQLENEFYSPVRFKQIPENGETQLDALEHRGVDYLELRAFDLNPFDQNGISLEQLYFTHVFILFCLFEPSGNLSIEDVAQIDLNAHKTALTGRSDSLMLNRANGHEVSIQQWGTEITDKLRKIARLLDRSTGDAVYEESVENQYKKIMNNSLLPSSRMIEEMKINNESFVSFNLRKARENSGLTSMNQAAC